MEQLKNNISQLDNPEEYYVREAIEADNVELLQVCIEVHSSLNSNNNDFEFLLMSGILYENILRASLETSSAAPIKIMNYIIRRISPSATMRIFSSLDRIDHCKMLYDCPELFRIFMLTMVESTGSISNNILLILRYIRRANPDILLTLHILEGLALKRCITIEDMVYITSMIEDIDDDHYCSILDLLTTDYGLVSRCQSRELRKIVIPLCRTKLDSDYLS